MKGSLLWKLAYVFCALAGLLVGYGIFSLSKENAGELNNSTKDNTLIRESGDSVFFDEEKEENQRMEVVLTPTTLPIPTAEPVLMLPTPTILPIPEVTSALQPVAEPTKTPAAAETQSSSKPNPEADTREVGGDVLPSLGSHWVTTGLITPPPADITEAPGEEILETEKKQEKDAVAETITYPAKIFGQTPVINRLDTYVSYFEFCYDLVSMMEPVVQARGLNINTLMTKFALKALFCGVDIEKLDINAPIPRRLAALCLWLAAQVLNEDGCETSSKSAGTYVTDISSCSSSERKAIAYLYEQRVVKGYQVAGQKFYPADGLKTKTGEAWLLEVKKSWK